jgi:GNAT superfamily N-acetyltransferase
VARKRGAAPAARLVTRELTPEMWPVVEALFGANGACGGCWCMFWRIEAGEKFADVKGARARRRFRALVESGRAHGAIAFAVDEDGQEAPVGWCALDRRVDLPKLDRAPSLRVADAERVWSLPCFYIKSGWRGRGVATALLAAAVEALRARGAEIAEGSPTKPKGGEPMPGAFAWTGVPKIFEAAGFELAEARPAGKQRYRLALAGDAAATAPARRGRGPGTSGPRRSTSRR